MGTYKNHGMNVHASLLLLLYPESIWALFLYSVIVRAGKSWRQLLDIGLDHVTKSSIILLSEAREDLVFAVGLNFRGFCYQVIPGCLQSSSKGFHKIRVLETATVLMWLADHIQAGDYGSSTASSPQLCFHRWSSVGLPTSDTSVPLYLLLFLRSGA